MTKKISIEVKYMAYIPEESGRMLEIPNHVITMIANVARESGPGKLAMVKFARDEYSLDIMTAKDLVEAIMDRSRFGDRTQHQD
jgi:hypothetical protein